MFSVPVVAFVTLLPRSRLGNALIGETRAYITDDVCCFVGPRVSYIISFHLRGPSSILLVCDAVSKKRSFACLAASPALCPFVPYALGRMSCPLFGSASERPVVCFTRSSLSLLPA